MICFLAFEVADSAIRVPNKNFVSDQFSAHSTFRFVIDFHFSAHYLTVVQMLINLIDLSQLRLDLARKTLALVEPQGLYQVHVQITDLDLFREQRDDLVGRKMLRVVTQQLMNRSRKILS